MTERPTAAPSPAEIEESLDSPGRELGRGYQGSVTLRATRAGDVVIKTAHGGALGALWRRLLRREGDVYARLTGIVGIPRCFGIVRGSALAIEYVAGPSLRQHEAHIVDRNAFFGMLLETVRAIHSAGVAHGDLKRKDNIIVGPDGRPYLIDFGIATRRSDRSDLWNRCVFEPLTQMDLNAWVKLKYGRRIDPQLEPQTLSPADAAIYRPLLIERVVRTVRVAWQTLTLRRRRERWQARNPDKD